ncbi:MAG: four helix bundle protein [Ignavibacteria bacterium]|nr:four helix bundle protein [Ignavibacteria bacterium]
MTSLPHASGFRELLVYQKARELARTIYGLTASFPKEETYSLTSQIRRSSRSIGANLAEAWAKRRYEKHFVSKLTDADGEQQETQHWIDTAIDCGYWTSENATVLREKCEEIGRLLGGMMAKAEMFCGESPRALREPPAEYFTSKR